MNNPPLVSIVIPVYNGSNYLRDSIDSALSQSYPNIEVVVVNDGSDDQGETEEIALSYGDKIRYYRKNNGGVSSALNFAIREMEGEFFSWLSHDDLYEKDKIHNQVSSIISLGQRNLVVYSKVRFIDAGGYAINLPRRNRLKPGVYSGDSMSVALLSGSSLNGCALLIPKSAIDEVGFFNEDWKFIQDFDYWLRLALAGYNFMVTSDVDVKSRIHSKQQTKKISHLRDHELGSFFL